MHRVANISRRNIKLVNNLTPYTVNNQSVNMNLCTKLNNNFSMSFTTASSAMSSGSNKHVMCLNDINKNDLKDKTVFVRVDYNVTMEKIDDGYQVKKSSYKRILESFTTLQYLLDGGAKVVIASHLGDPKDNSAEFSLAPAAKVVSEKLGVPCHFVEDCIGDKVAQAVSQLKTGEILLLENLRYHKGEKKNLPEFVEAIVSAVKPDVYVNDAFGTAHRAHASVVGIPEYLKQHSTKKVPCVSGFLMGKEVKYLNDSLPSTRSDDNKFAAILGGAKVTSKLPVFANLLPRVHKVLVGGAMALPFLKAQGYAISHVDEQAVLDAQKVLEQAKETNTKIVLPVDFLTSTVFEDPAVSNVAPVVYDIENLPGEVFCLDIGPKSIELFHNELSSMNTFVWNGPLGKFEWAEYAKGSLEMVRTLSEQSGVSVVGGGETTQVVKLAKDHNIDVKITHVSTGGGASLEMLEGKTLPAIAALDSC